MVPRNRSAVHFLLLLDVSAKDEKTIMEWVEPVVSHPWESAS